MTNWQKREAARIGNTAAIESADDMAAQRRAREVRAENMRRAAAAAGGYAYFDGFYANQRGAL